MDNNEMFDKFERLFDCHKEAITDAAHNRDEIIWINMCNIYGFREKASELKRYILSRPVAKRI